jgi:hypothetical protein
VGKISCLVAEGGYVESRTYLNDGNWHHLAVVVSSSERRYKIYVDGQLDSDTHLQVPITNSLNPYSISQQKPILEIPVNYLVFGNVWKNEPESAFGGTLDDIGVWSKALSDSEISQLFNSFYTSASRPNVRIDDRIKSISSNLNTNYTSSFNPKTVKSLNSDTSLNFFNPNTDIYINSREAAEYPDFKNSYACFGRFKNSGIRNDYYFGREIVNRLISYFNSLGYDNLLTIGQTIKAGDASGLNGYYTYVEFKEMNPIIMKKLMILLFSLGNGEQQIPYSKNVFALDMCTYGYINNDGRVIVKPEYDYVSEFSEGLALVSKINASGISKSGFVDENGKLVVPLIYESTSNAFSDGVCWVQGKGGKYGYIDKSGKLIIPFQYDQAQDFKNGIAEIRKGEIWSKIDKRGMPTVGKNKFPNSKLRELSVQGNSLDNKINKLFEDMYNEINAKTLFFGKSASSQKTIALETLKIRKIVEDWLGGPMTSPQLLEFNQISKRVAGVSNLIMSAVSNSLSSSSSSARPGYGEQIGGQNRNASSSSSNVTSDQKCGMCTPSDSRGYSLRDYNISSRTYSNFRYVKRPGYKLCQSCWGTGLQSQTGPNVCNQCKGERFIKCNYCHGTGKKS